MGLRRPPCPNRLVLGGGPSTRPGLMRRAMPQTMTVSRVLGRSASRLTRSLSAPAHAPCPEVSGDDATSLLKLPDDVLWLIIQTLTRVPESPGDYSPGFSCVDRAGYTTGIRLASTCRAFAERFFASLDALALPSATSLDDAAVSFIARHAGSAVRRLVLRNCTKLTDAAVLSISRYMKSLRSVDLSFISDITDSSVMGLCSSVGPQLEKLLLRKCEKLTDKSLSEIARCSNLHTLDLSHIGEGISDSGMVLVCRGCGPSLRLLSISHNSLLSDDTFVAVGRFCRNLEQLCARSLPLVSDAGFSVLCRGVGPVVYGLDVIDCWSLTKDSLVRTIREYCVNIQLTDPENHSLRNIVISTLRHNIYIIKGADPGNGRQTVHTCVVDNGDIASACILMAGTTDLSLVSLVLAKSYGSSLDEETVGMLSNSYGLPAELLS